jgi:hypothetical protein
MLFIKLRRKGMKFLFIANIFYFPIKIYLQLYNYHLDESVLISLRFFHQDRFH